MLHTLPSLPRALWAPSLAAVWSAAAAIISAYEPDHAIPRTALPEPPNADDPVTELLGRAAEHGDEHVIKFTDTATEVYARSGNPDTLAAALQASRLIGPAL